jgi:hypothetical protein
MVTSGTCLVACALFWFLFYTAFGLDVQIALVLKMHTAYLRFFSSRLAATNNETFQELIAVQLNTMAGYDLMAADEAANEATSHRPDPIYFRDRARIEMRMLSYSNAAADFDQALTLWKQGKGGFFDFDPIGTSNNVEMAKACAEAKEKYSRFSKRPPANPPPPSEQVTNAEAQSKGPKSQ